MKPISRRSALSALLVWTFCPLPAPAAEIDPIELVAAIYRRATAGKGNGGGEFLWRDAKGRRAHFTARTAALWDRAERATAPGDARPVGFDPVTASQDPSLKSFDIKLEEDGPDRARVVVALTGHGEGKPYATLRYLLSREGGNWLIDDITSARRGGTESWSLRKLLETDLAENRRGR